MSGFGGGISSFILNKATHFKGKNIIFDVLTFDEVPPHFKQAIEETGGKVYKMPNPKKAGFRNYYQQVNDNMSQLPKTTFIHCHIRGYRAIPFHVIAKKNGIKRFGMHAHTTGLPEEINSLKNRCVRWINNLLADERISCGVEASKYLFGEKYLKKKEIMHIPNSINAEDFIPKLNVTKESLFGSEIKDKYLIGHIGRFYSVKNHDFMLSIVEKLAQGSLEFMWLFIGDGKDFEGIKKEVKNRNLQNYVHFLGRRNDIPEILQSLDLFVLPSKYEGFPTVAVESQASGTKTFLSNRITEEADLQLGLVKFLPIENPEIWVEEILETSSDVETSPLDRLDRLKQLKLTNEESAQLYEEFLKQTITHYELDKKEGTNK